MMVGALWWWEQCDGGSTGSDGAIGGKMTGSSNMGGKKRLTLERWRAPPVGKARHGGYMPLLCFGTSFTFKTMEPMLFITVCFFFSFFFLFFFHKTNCCALVGQMSRLLGKESCVGLLPEAACALHSSLCTRLWIVFPSSGLSFFPVTGISQSLAGGLWIDRSIRLCACVFILFCAFLLILGRNWKCLSQARSDRSCFSPEAPSDWNNWLGGTCRRKGEVLKWTAWCSEFPKLYAYVCMRVHTSTGHVQRMQCLGKSIEFGIMNLRFVSYVIVVILWPV